ncbi:UNVERIFIED_CONTAM: hypothetical protein GTU68_001062 [Idotea baltica]|nr:hypothetical protein [Idotea baltica]
MSTVKQILSIKGNDVFTIPPETQVMDALKIMNDKRVGALIIKEGESVKGVFTEQDYIRRVLLKELDSDKTVVNDVMTKNILTIKPQNTVNESMQLMTEKHIRHLPVIEGEKLIGIISIGDCVKEVIAEQEQIIGHLEQYIQS